MIHKFAGFVVLVALVAYASTSSHNGYKLYEITPATHEQCDLLFELSKHEDLYDFFMLSKVPGNSAHVMVTPSVESEFTKLLHKHRMEYSVINENLGDTIDAEFRKNKQMRKLRPSNGKGRLSTERYYTHQEINNYIDDLAVRFPSRVFVKTVGFSYEGRVMKTITITNGDTRANKNVIFVDGGFHAREWISPATVLYIIEQLVEKFNENSHLLADYDWIILPVVNPDGYEYTQESTATRLWRKTRTPHSSLTGTCYGVDPNRNFDFHWMEGGASGLPCVDTFAGPIPFSEHETIVVRDLLHSLKGRGIMYLTLHSYGNYLLYPWGWTSDLPDTWRDLDEVAQAGGQAIKDATGTQYSIGSSTNVLYIAAGASDDYAFSVGFPISITMELTGGGISGFDPPVEKIDPYVKEAWIGIYAMALKVVQKYPLVSLK